MLSSVALVVDGWAAGREAAGAGVARGGLVDCVVLLFRPPKSGFVRDERKENGLDGEVALAPLAGAGATLSTLSSGGMLSLSLSSAGRAAAVDVDAVVDAD